MTTSKTLCSLWCNPKSVFIASSGSYQEHIIHILSQLIYRIDLLPSTCFAPASSTAEH